MKRLLFIFTALFMLTAHVSAGGKIIGLGIPAEPLFRSLVMWQVCGQDRERNKPH